MASASLPTVKQRPSTAQLTDSSAGRVERWRKWSYDLAGLDGIPLPQAEPLEAWIRVTKQRQLRKFSVTGGGAVDRVVEVVPADVVECGCLLELSRLEVV